MKRHEITVIVMIPHVILRLHIFHSCMLTFNIIVKKKQNIISIINSFNSTNERSFSRYARMKIFIVSDKKKWN